MARSQPQRKLARSLAQCFHNKFSDDLITEWFAVMLSGRCPKIVEDERYIDGYKIVADEQRAVSVEDIKWAMGNMMLRRDGAPMQAVQIQADITKHEAALGVVDPDVLAGLSQGSIAQILAILVPKAPSTPASAVTEDEGRLLAEGAIDAVSDDGSRPGDGHDADETP